MRKKLFALMLMLLPVWGWGQGMRFETNGFEKALEKTVAEKKILFIDAYAVWCGPCKWMEENVFLDAEVGNVFNRYFIGLQIDVERGEGPRIRKRFAIEGLPGYVFLDVNGNVIFREVGRMSKTEFLRLLEKARDMAADIDELGHMAARYEAGCRNEEFLRDYLDKLKNSNAKGYYGVVEEYLKIQKSIADTAVRMACFLHDHINSLTFGGEADRILRENLWTYPWDAYVRKNVREDFQKLPEKMVSQTVEYAIVRRDTALLSLATKSRLVYGLPLKEGEKEQLWEYYYAQTGDGENYKRLMRPRIEAFYGSLDVVALRKKHEELVVRNVNSTRRWRSYAMINSEKLRYMASEYARFASSPEDGALLLKWAKCVHDLLPADLDNMAFYAKALYLYGDEQEGLRIMENVVECGKNNKKYLTFLSDLQVMQNSQPVVLRF